MSKQRMIDGHTVTHVPSGDRGWHCTCSDFAEAGRCIHTWKASALKALTPLMKAKGSSSKLQ